MAGKSEVSSLRDHMAVVARKAVVSLAASAAGAASAYAVRKLPKLVEEKVLPRLREQGGARAAAQKATKKAAHVMEKAAQRVGLAPTQARSRSRRPTVPAAQPSADGRAAVRKQREERRRGRRRSLNQISPS